MKITIYEDPDLEETQVDIRCRAADAQLLQAVALLRGNATGKLPGSRNGSIHLIDIQALLYCESVDKKTFLYTADAVYETALRLYEIEERLPGDSFFRVSKSAIVSVEKIHSLRPELGGRLELTLQNAERLVVSRQYSAQLKRKLGLK